MDKQPTLLWAFFSMSGRIGPSVCLLGGMLVAVVQLFLFYQVLRVAPGTAAASFWETLFGGSILIAAWSNFALTAKRFHDFGKPTALGAISLVVGPVLFVILYFFKSDPGPNRYGAVTNAPA